MIPPQRYFPWRVARHLFFVNLFAMSALIVGTGFVLRFRAIDAFSATRDVHEALGKFDSYLASVIVGAFAVSTLFLALSSAWFALPLARVVQRARQLRSLGRDDLEQSADLDEPMAGDGNDPGEWADVERALNRIQKNLRAKTEALSREHEELTALIGAVSEAILAVDRIENALFFNSQFAFLFGGSALGSRSLRLGELFRTPEVLQGFREVLATGRMVTITATLHTRQHELPRHFSISIAPLVVSAEKPGASSSTTKVDGAVGVFHDVTELKQAEQIRIEFVGNASHELRTPLTTIKGYVDTLREDVKQKHMESVPEFVDIISRNVDRLNLLVNDLLDLSTLESGAAFVKSEVSTGDITEGVLKELEAKRSLKRQKINTSFAAGKVLAEPHRLEQVLLNLVHNAIKYIPEGSHIDIVWERSDKDVILRVKDNGPGIALENQGRLFERFYRVDPGRSREQGGTGLGLSIVKHIMNKHGGSVRVLSRQGEGAEFICVFPGS